MLRSAFLFICAIPLIFGCNPKDEANSSAASTLAGNWQSEPVKLIRGDLDETYVFHLVLSQDQQTNVMDIMYGITDDTTDQRTIRQDLSIQMDSAQLVLAGTNPTLIDGPTIVGEYAPDILYCDLSAQTAEDTLICDWGSDAHGEPPIVKLQRLAGD